MAKINHVKKSRKEVKCSKCGKTLPVGSEYLHATPYHSRMIIRCTDCGLRPWETSTSDFVQTCGRISEDWKEDYGTDVESIKTDLEELRDTCQDSLDNMPDSLQYGPTGEMLQERIDMLEDVLNSLEGIDYDSVKDEVTQDYLDENELEDDWDLTDEQNNEVETLVNERIEEEIEDALSDLCF